MRYNHPKFSFLLALSLFVVPLLPGILKAACSPYHGLATINEIHDQGVVEYFVEVKPLDNTIHASIYNNWTITICNDTPTCNGPLALGLANQTNYPWLVIGKESVSDPDDPIGDPNLIDVSKPMDVILKDANGYTIDYVSLNGYIIQQDVSCTPAYDWQVNITQSNTNTIQRIPDGTGTWAGAPGGSNPPTDTTTNDPLPDGSTPPSLSLSHVIVASGQTANFILTLEAATAYDITIDFQTLDDTALAGTNYTATSGTISIPAGTAAGYTVTIPVTTLLPPPASDIDFYLFFDNPINVALPSQFATGTITSSVLILDTRLDECSWAPASPDVIDSSGNNLHGAAVNGLFPLDISEEKGGICMAAAFDGNDDYIQLPPSFPNLQGSFTISAWIRADNLGGDQRIFVDDQNNSGGFAFSLNDGGDGRLRFFSRNVNPIILDTGVVIQEGKWHFITAVHNALTKTRRIYVDANMVASDTYTGSWGIDNGFTAIGGEPDGSSESTAQWRFEGAIDEVLVFGSVVSDSMINIIYTNQLAKKNYDGSSRTCNVCGPPADTFVMSTDGDARLVSPILLFDNNDAVEYSASASTATLLHNIGALFSSGANLINALHLHTDGHVYFSPSENSTTIAALGSQTYDADDILEYDPVAGTLSLFFNGDSHFTATDENIDALFVDAADNIYISTTGGATIGGVVIEDEDLVQYTPSTGVASLYFVGDDHFSWDVDLDAVHIIDSNTLLISTTDIARLGPNGNRLTFTDGDVVMYNTATRAPTLFFDETTEFQNNEEIDALSIRPPFVPTIDHFIISHDGSAITCNTDTITITACQDAACLTQYTGAVDLTLTAYGNTSGTTDTIPLSFSGGSTTYALRHTTPEVVTLDITGPTPTPTNAKNCLNTTSGTASCDITFYEAGFIFDVPTQTACQTSANVTISAVRTDLTTQQCIPGFINRTEDISFWSTYLSPLTGTKAVQINSTNIASTTPGTAIPLTFDASGQSTFDVTYDDAGQMQLNARFDGSGLETGLVMLGNDTFIVKPDHFQLAATKSDGTTSLNNITSGGTPIEAAGNQFRISAHAVCADNTTVTQNYLPTNAQIWIERTGPTAGGSEGTLTFPNLTPPTPPSYATSLAASPSWNNVSALFSTGILADPTLSYATATYSEVGLITLHLRDSNYFGETIAENTTPIGRFTPHHYKAAITNAGALNGQCGGSFTYIGQPMRYSSQPALLITAENTFNNTTQNYTGAFVKLSPANFTFTTPSEDTSQEGFDGSNMMQITTAIFAGALTDNTNGTITFTLSNADTFTYDKDGNSMIGSFTSDIRMPLASVQDSDLVSATSPAPLPTLQPAGALILFGRLEADNTYGPETLDLIVPISTSYYDGTLFTTNALDTCTSLTIIPAPPPFPQWGDIVLPTASYTDNLNEGETAPTSVSLTNGIGTITLSAPGLGNEGTVGVSVDLSGAGLSWLQYDWADVDGLADGPHDGDPFATVTFGIYRGNDRIINWREIVR